MTLLFSSVQNIVILLIIVIVRADVKAQRSYVHIAGHMIFVSLQFSLI